MNTEIAAIPSSIQLPTPHSQLPTSPGDRRAVLLAVAAFALLSATMAVASTAFLEGDACTHYMFARAAFADPYFFVNVWGRPLCTGLYALPAHLGGRLAVRMTSLAVAITIALATRAIARRQGYRWPALAAVFTFAQPLLFLHSFSELTELPFALLMTLAFLAYQRRRWFWMAAVVGLMPLSRPEGFGFVLLAAAALLLHGRARWWVVLGVPLLAWDLAGWGITGCHVPWWRWLADNWPYSGDSLYDRGPLLKYVGLFPCIVGPVVFPATLIGIWLCLRGSRDGLPWAPVAVERVPSLPSRVLEHARIDVRDRSWSWLVTDHARRCDVLIAVIPLMVLVGHSLLQWLGKMASNGEIRYMLVVAPFWALLSARGWGWVFDRMSWPHARLWAGLAATLPVLANRAYGILPQQPMPDWVEAAQIAEWYRSPEVSARFPHIAIAHPGLSYALGFGPREHRSIDWQKRVIDACPAGTLVVWDYPDALFNAAASRSISLAEIERAGFVPIETRWTGRAAQWHFFRSPDVSPLGNGHR